MRELITPRVMLAVAVLAVTGCPQRVPCETTSCAGCCDADGACQVGNTELACGLGGFTCDRCGALERCTLGQCIDPSTPPIGGASGAGGGTGGMGGGGGGGFPFPFDASLPLDFDGGFPVVLLDGGLVLCTEALQCGAVHCCAGAQTLGVGLCRALGESCSLFNTDGGQCGADGHCG